MYLCAYVRSGSLHTFCGEQSANATAGQLEMCIRDSGYAAQRECVIIGAAVAHNTYGAGVGQNCKIPVSYTHLDVYKRQLLYPFITFINMFLY